MRTLAFVALTASAALAAPAIAQDSSGAPSAPAAAVAMASSAAGGGMHRGGGMHMQPPGHTWHAPPPGMHRPPMMHGGRHFQFRRIQRGGFVPPFFWGGGFQIGNWGLYGFPPPGDGARWIRYYDDALLIDRSGRVIDGRYGWDWDRYGDDWDYDGDAPVRRGHHRDYAEDDRDDRGPPPGYDGPPPHGYEGPPPADYHRGPPPGAMCGNPCTRTYVMHGGPGAPPPPPPAYGHGYYGAYGCGCGPVLVSETIVTTPPVVEKRVYTTYVTQWVKAKPRKVYRRPPPPPPGERG